MKAQPNSYLDVAVLQPKTVNALRLMHNKAGNPQTGVVFSLTVSPRHCNRKNILLMSSMKCDHP